MLNTILGALLPMVVTFVLGFIAAWHHDFGRDDAPILNRMVLRYALPLTILAGTVTTSRSALSHDIPLVIALCLAIIGLYGAVFLFLRIVSHLSTSISALYALMASAPAVPFVGPAVLGDLFGGLSVIPIAISSLVINLTVVPVTILLLELDATGRASVAAQEKGRSASPVVNLAEAFKEPVVWAPFLAFVVVLSGLHIPRLIVHSLSLLGVASGGVGLFASGIVLASGKIKINTQVLIPVFAKNILQPALALGGLRWAGYGGPIVSEAVLSTAIPTVPIVFMFALQYRVAQEEAASGVFLSIIGSFITMGIFIALTR
jgi:malonate transporter and related proteins